MKNTLKLLPILAVASSLPVQNSDFCETNSDGIYAVKTDCSKFVMCSSGHKFDYDCPHGLLFNPDILACDWAENTNCGNQINPTEKPAEITTEKPTINPIIDPNDPAEPDQPSTPTQCSNYFKYNVIYIDWRLNWSDFKSDIVNSIDNCYNIINLSFWMSERGFVDAAAAFASLSKSDQQEILDYAHSKGAKIMLSAGGATESIEDMVENGSGTDYGTRAANAAIELGLDGVDFDLELEPGNNDDFLNGQMDQFVIDCSTAARNILGSERLISHAPQAPYLGTWAGEGLGYTRVMNQYPELIDFLNIQFYNQGATQYVTYSSLFMKAVGWTAKTAVSEMIDNGIPADKIVVGKPIGPAGFASDGFVEASNLNDWSCEFEGSEGFRIGGFMNWMYPGPNDNLIQFGKAVSMAC